jgi:hypothetical protein
MSFIDQEQLKEDMDKFYNEVDVFTDSFAKPTFQCGVEYAEQKITPLFVEFAEYYYKYRYGIAMKERRMGHYGETKTTKEVFVLWCKEREKK